MDTIILHNWWKLFSIWKGLNVEYKAALTCYTQFGTHDSYFFNFCIGKIDPYYLCKNLELRPGLNDMVEADLPQECSLSSDMLGDTKSAIKCSPASKRKRGGDDIADVIRDFLNSPRQADLAKQKMFFREKEDKRREHKTSFDLWEQIQVQLRSLREDLTACTDDSINVDLNDDIEGLVQQKRHLVSELGFK